jgi:putative drug exporter of the RND superfamily
VRAILAIVTGRRSAWVVLIGCLVALALAIAFVPRANHPAANAALGSAGDSQRVSALLIDFPSPGSSYAIVVWHRRDGGDLSAADRASVNAQVPALEKLSTQESALRPELAADRRAMLLEVPVDAARAANDAPDLAAAVRAAATGSLTRHLRAEYSGTLVAAADSQGQQAVIRLWVLVAVGALVALVIMLFTRRLLAVIAGLFVTAGAAWLGLVVGQAVCSGLGLPFSLDAGTTVVAALLVATALFCLTPSALYVALSGAVIEGGMLILLFASSPDAVAIGVVGAIGVVLSVFLALTLLRSALAIIQRAGFGLVPANPRGEAMGAARPVRSGLVGGAIIGLLVFGGVAAQLAVTAVNAGSQDAGSERAQRLADSAFGVGTGNQVILLVPAVLSGSTSVVAPDTVAMTLTTVHSVLRLGTVSDRSELLVALDADPGSARALTSIDSLRAKFERAGGLTAHTLVGGTDAATLDARAAAQRDLVTVIPIGAAILVLVLLGGALGARRRRPA